MYTPQSMCSVCTRQRREANMDGRTDGFNPPGIDLILRLTTLLGRTLPPPDLLCSRSQACVRACENTCTPPHAPSLPVPNTLRHPPQEETTAALPAALKRRSWVPLSVPPGFLCLHRRKEALLQHDEATGPGGATGGEAGGGRVEVVVVVCMFVRAWSPCRRVAGGFVRRSRSHAFTRRGPPPL